MDCGTQLEHFSLRWNNFNDNMKTGFHDLLRREDFVDVTIAAEGKIIQAHKMVLSICSPYFKNIFKTNPCQHPVVFLKDVTHKELSGILQFMYLGEVSVQQEELGKFLKTAEALQIKGLTGDDSNEKQESSTDTSKENHIYHHKNKTKLSQTESLDKGLVSPKRAKLSSTNGLNKGNIKLQTPIQNCQEINSDQQSYDSEVYPKTEPSELELSDVESDRVSSREDGVGRNESLSQFMDNTSELGDELNNSPNTSGVGSELFTGMTGLPSEPFTMSDGNQEIRFVMSPRMRPCLVFNNYLYIKDHIGVAMPGQPKTIYWRCKDISCKARCIQTDFKFRLKRNTYHQHPPNIDKSYLPIHMNRLQYFPILTKNQGLCPICGRILQHKKNLQTHIADQHSGIFRCWPCQICHKVCKTWSALRVHTNRHHTKLGSAPLLDLSQQLN